MWKKHLYRTDKIGGFVTIHTIKLLYAHLLLCKIQRHKGIYDKRILPEHISSFVKTGKMIQVRYETYSQIGKTFRLVVFTIGKYSDTDRKEKKLEIKSITE